MKELGLVDSSEQNWMYKHRQVTQEQQLCLISFQTKGASQCQMYYYYFLRRLFHLFIILNFWPHLQYGKDLSSPTQDPTRTHCIEGGVVSTGLLGKSWHHYFKLTNKDKHAADLMMAHH